MRHLHVHIGMFIYLCLYMGGLYGNQSLHKTKITQKSFSFFKFVLHHFVFSFAVKAEKVNGDIAFGSDKAS